MLWTTCGHNSVRRAVPVDARPARTVLYMDDRSVTSSSAESLSHHKNAWSLWSGHVGLIENESKVSLAVKSPKLPVPALLAPFVQSTVRVLGAYTAVARRRMCPDEEQRLAKASQTISLLASIQLPFRVFHQYVAMFAMPQASYGWVSRLPTVAAASRLWSSVRRGDGKCFMANKHIRATNTSVLFSSVAIPIWKFSLSNISWVLSPAPSIVRSFAGMAHLAVLFALCVRLSKT